MLGFFLASALATRAELGLKIFEAKFCMQAPIWHMTPPAVFYQVTKRGYLQVHACIRTYEVRP